MSELEEQRETLLKSLRDLEKERAAGEITEADYAALKDDYTVRAAAVLRALETSGSTRRPPNRRPRPAAAARRPANRGPAAGGRPERPRRRPAAPAAASPARSRRSLAVTLAVAFAIIALAGITVVLTAGDREPGEPVTGGQPPPSSATSKVDQALSLESEGRAVDALMLYDEVIAEDPENAEALAYKGWLLKRAGLADEALDSLDRAVAADPTFADAHFFRGMVLYQDKDDPAAAIVEFDAFLANNPPPEFVESVRLVKAKAEAAAAAKASGAPAPPPDSTPADAPLPTG